MPGTRPKKGGGGGFLGMRGGGGGGDASASNPLLHTVYCIARVVMDTNRCKHKKG